MDYKKLGKRIREERLRLNLTQEHLSEDIGISTAYLGQIERGERNITLDKLITLTNRLGVTVDFLLNDYVTAANEDLYQKIMLQ
ncbi:MAG: helix-turn-helix transcriptional regulator, partial [Schwartzia sp.]|nr:helix-turn-helix transcriptional regulator [Schwartzia sp. (in: firmicutes)]